MNKLFRFREEALVAAFSEVEKGATVLLNENPPLYPGDIEKPMFLGEIPIKEFKCIGVIMPYDTYERWGWISEIKTMGDLARFAEKEKGARNTAFRLACFNNGWQALIEGYALTDLAYDPINHEVLTYDPEFGYVVRLGEPRRLKNYGARPEE